jgi:hypothetical protein
MDAVYFIWREVEGNGSRVTCSIAGVCSTSGTEKIDYIFGSSGVREAGTTRISTISDHRYVRAEPAVDW